MKKATARGRGRSRAGLLSRYGDATHTYKNRSGYNRKTAQEIFECPIRDLGAASDRAKIIKILGDEISEERSRELRDFAYGRAHELLLANKTKVTRVALRLMENERIDGSEFVELMKVADIMV